MVHELCLGCFLPLLYPKLYSYNRDMSIVFLKPIIPHYSIVYSVLVPFHFMKWNIPNLYYYNYMASHSVLLMIS